MVAPIGREKEDDDWERGGGHGATSAHWRGRARWVHYLAHHLRSDKQLSCAF